MTVSSHISRQLSGSRLRDDRRIAVGIFFLVLAVYVLTYVGAFKSNDERAMFAGTDSFVKRGEFTVNQIYWDYTNVGMLTSRGDMVPNYEPAQMIAAIPFYLWGRALGAAVQGAMFFNLVVMAATAALLSLCFLELDYRRRTATLGALVFAFATLAWPYSRTFFREPLTVLAYLLAVYGLLRYGHTNSEFSVQRSAFRKYRWLALTGAALGLALTTKQISVALVPSLLVILAGYEWSRPVAPADGSRLKVWLRIAAATLAPLALFLILGRVYTAVTLGGVEVFARNIVEYTTNPQLSQSVPARMLRAGLGITVSPYKGLFWYAPVLLLGLVGAIPFTRRHRWEGLAFLLLVAAHILGYSRYNYWSAGVAWGMRYLLPAIPFLVLLAAPVWQWTLGEGSRVRDQVSGGKEVEIADSADHVFLRDGSQSRFTQHVWLRRLGLLAVWLLVGLSLAIQVLGVSVDLRTYELRFLLDNARIWGGIGQAIEALYMKPAYSPVLGHLRLLLSGAEPLDFAWVQRRQMGQTALVPQGLLLSLGFLALAVAVFVWIWRRPSRAGLAAAVMTGVTLIVSTLLVIFYRTGDARFDTYGVDRFLRPMMARLDQAPCGWRACDQAFVVPDPSLTDYFLNYLQAPLVWYGIDPNSSGSGAPGQTRGVDTTLMDHLTTRYGRLWLGRDRNAQTDDQQGHRAVERYLAEHANKLGEQQFENWARLLQYSAAGDLAEIAEPQQPLGDMVLERAMLGIEQHSGQEIGHHPGGTGENNEATGGNGGDLQTPLPSEGRGWGRGSDPLDDGKVQARSGDTLQVGLNWRATSTPAANYTVFVQLLDQRSQVKAQLDRWPGDGLFPTADLSAGEAITDNLALVLDVPPGQYELIAGLYRNDVEGLPRLQGPGGDFVLLGEIDVRQPEH